MSYKCMCGDCGAEVVLASRDSLTEAEWAVWDGNRLCACGGDVCDCGACLDALKKLNSGVRHFDDLNPSLFYGQGPFKWSPVRGFSAAQ